jgi:hypothetical protein
MVSSLVLLALSTLLDAAQAQNVTSSVASTSIASGAALSGGQATVMTTAAAVLATTMNLFVDGRNLVYNSVPS